MFDKKKMNFAIGVVLGACTTFSAFAQLNNAPTINTLSQLQRAEHEKAAQKRMEALNPPPPTPPTPTQPTAAEIAAKAAAVVKPKEVFNTTKTVVAIYGRQGSEVAEIAMPDGLVRKILTGQNFEGYKVTAITKSRVNLEKIVSSDSAQNNTKVRKAKYSSGTYKHNRNAQKTASSDKKVETPRTLSLQTGGKFD